MTLLRPSCYALLLATAGACTTEEPLFVADYLDTYTQTRPCRSSAEHELHNVTVFTSPSATDPYTMRVAPFPTGAIVLKVEYNPEDMACAGPIIEWTVMEQLEAGSSPATLDWRWQDIDPNRHVISDNNSRCFNCHEGCGVPPTGYLDTCSAPSETSTDALW